MKKIVGIIAALALVAGVAFADDPSVAPSLVSFSGNATFGWKADLDNETHGMYNTNEASLKITFVPKEVKKSTSGEPLWGELVIETGAEAHEQVKGGTYSVPSASVKTAKIHFIDSDDGFFFHMDILKPNFEVGGIKGALATDTEIAFAGVKAGDAAGTPNGFTLKFGVPLISFDVAFGDNGADAAPAWGASDGADAPVATATTKSVKYYSFKVATTIKPIDGLEIGAGIAMSTTTDKDKLALGVTAKYTYAINDSLSLIPALAFSAYDMKDQALGASLLFKWGADGQEPKFIKFTDAIPTVPVASLISVGDKCTNGFSVFFTKTLDADEDDGALGFAVFDNTLLGLVGEDAGTLSLGAKFTTSTKEFKDDAALAFAAKYENTFAKDSDLPIGFTAKFSLGMLLGLDEDNTAMAYSIGLSQKTLIANTELYLNYAGSKSKLPVKENAEKGAIDIGCKISL